MKAFDDYASEGYVEGMYYMCMGEKCRQSQAKAESDYWATFDVEAFRSETND